MSRRSFLLTPELASYYTSVAVEQPAPLASLAASSDTLTNGQMRSSPEAGRFLAMLIKLTGAKRAFEVGVFTGYSAAWIASALPDGGHLAALDITDEYLGPGRKIWHDMGLSSRIEFVKGDAGESLTSLADHGGTGQYDFGFIDADKSGYPAYYDAGLKLLRPGGLMVFDNALMGGQVGQGPDARADLTEPHPDPDVEAVREVTRRAFADPTVEASLLLLSDGLLLVRKK